MNEKLAAKARRWTWGWLCWLSVGLFCCLPCLLLDLADGGYSSAWLGLPVGEGLLLTVKSVACAGWWALSAGAGMLFWWMLTRVTGARWSDPLATVWRRDVFVFLAVGCSLAVLAASFGAMSEAGLQVAPSPSAVALALGAGLALLALAMRAAQRSGKEKHLRFVSAVGLIALVVLMAVLAVAGDGGWVTSMAPLSGMAQAAAAALAFALLAPEAREPSVCRPTLLLLAVVLAFGLYFSFSRFLIVSYGQIPSESSFYQLRRTDEWEGVSLVLGVLGVALPLAAALLATLYRRAWAVRLLAKFVLATTMAEACWRALPPVSTSAYVGLVCVALSLLPLAILTSALARQRAENAKRVQ